MESIQLIFSYIFVEPGKPRELDHDEISEPHAIILSWREPDPPNGIITNYFVCYVQVTNDGESTTNPNENCANVDGNTTSFTLTGLGNVLIILLHIPYCKVIFLIVFIVAELLAYA